jgi:hypothetical protein
VAVDGVAAVGREGGATPRLLVRAARLGVLTGHAAHLDDREAGAVGEDGGHLQDRLDLVPDPVRGGLRERLRAVPALEQERLAARRHRQLLAQAVRLAGEDQRWELTQLRGHPGQLALVGPLGLLRGGELAPVLEAAQDLRCRLDTHPDRIGGAGG